MKRHEKTWLSGMWRSRPWSLNSVEICEMTGVSSDVYRYQEPPVFRVFRESWKRETILNSRSDDSGYTTKCKDNRKWLLLP